MKGDTEDKVRVALNQAGMGLVVYKPPDDARNWKPCDFMVWWGSTDTWMAKGVALRGTSPSSAWIDVKDNRAVGTFALADIRPSQRQGIAAASSIGLPYWLVVWWREQKRWTISNAVRLMGDVAAEEEASTQRVTSVTFGQLSSKLGIDSGQNQLGSTLAMALRGEL
jgi:hypothetical protein